MTAHEIIAAALEDMREHRELWRAGTLLSVDGRMCVLGFLNKHAGRTCYDACAPEGERGQDYMVYPQEAVTQGVLADDHPLVAAAKHVAECAVKHRPAIAADTPNDDDMFVIWLNDNYGYDACIEALECAEETTR